MPIGSSRAKAAMRRLNWKRVIQTERTTSSVFFGRRSVWISPSRYLVGLLSHHFTSCHHSIQRMQSRMLSFSAAKSHVWLPREVPNPMKSPELAGRIGVARSCVCDPDNILSTSTKNVIEGYINSSKTQMAAVVISKISDDFIYSHGDNESAARAFAIQLHNDWGVGSAQAQDGVLILLSIYDKMVYISTGSSVQDRLDADVIQCIIEDMRKYLRRGDYGTAMEFVVLQVDSIINNDEAHQKAKSSAALGKGVSYGMVALFALYLAKILADDHQRAKREEAAFRRRLEMSRRLRSSEDDLERIYDSDDVSCSHCLGLYDDTIVPNDGQSPAAAPSKVTLECGHKLCRQCYEGLVAAAMDTGDKGTCTICASPLAIQSDPAKTEEGSRPVSRTWFVANDKISTPSPSYSTEDSALYRMQRYCYYYGDVLSEQEMETIRTEIGKGISYGRERMRARLAAIKQRREKEEEERRIWQKEQTERRMRDMEDRRKAESSGSSGSDSDWGGGSSGGGGGGSW